MSKAGRSGQPDYSGTVLGPRMVPATYERRTIILNDLGITSGAPPSNRSADDYGKFFPRGMRGTLEEIRVYALGDGVDTVYVNISPQPGLGYTYRIQITPPAAWGWVDAAFNVMWNYDSLYVWFSDIEANVYWGYDEVLPFDGHLTADSGATFTDVDERPFIRVVMTGETAGDVPISGIVNNIPIPSTSSKFTGAATTVPIDTWKILAWVYGAGFCELIEVAVWADTDSHLSRFQVLIDGVQAMDVGFSSSRGHGHSPTTPPIAIIRYKESGACRALVTHRFEFKRSLVVQGYHETVQQHMVAGVHPTLLR